MLPAQRPLTAFELFLQKRQAAAEASGPPEVPRLHLSPVLYVESHQKVSRPEVQARAAESSPPAAPRQPGPSSLQSSYNRPYGSYSDRPTSQQRNLRRSAPDLTPEVVASLPSPRLPAGSAGAPTGAPAGAGVGAPARDVSNGRGGPTAARPAATQTTTTAVYGELASAAASLASAAHKLARGSAADHSVAASYETLAQAAADLAASACMIRPLSSAIGKAHVRSGQSFHVKALPPQPEPARSASLPRAVDPMAAAAAAEVAAAAAGTSAASAPAAGARAPQAPGPPHRARPGTGAGGGVPGGRGRVQAPRFPGYNPMIHFLESDLLPPRGSTGAGRPITSCPITHQLQESRPTRPGSGASSAASSRLRSCRSCYLGPTPLSTPGYGPGAGLRRLGRTSDLDGGGMLQPLLHPADLSRLPMLSLDADGAARSFGGGGGGGVADVWSSDPRVQQAMQQDGIGGARVPATAVGGMQRASGVDFTGGGQLVDPHCFLAPYTDVRLAEWPPTEPITMNDMEQEELDMRYNKLLSALRERMHARGPGRLAAAFRDVDRDGIGLVSQRDFMAVLQSLNLGSPGLVDEKVVDLMLASFEGGARGPAVGAAGSRGGAVAAPAAARAVPYSDFVNAVRFGALPWRGYNRKLRHRMGGDPDQPIGPPSMAAGSLPYGVTYSNGQPSAAGPAAARNSAAVAANSGAPAGGGPGDVALGPGSHLAAKWTDLLAAFQQLDHNADGVVEWAEFKEALRRVGERHRLQLSEKELMQIYQEADPDFTRGVNYEAFMSTFGGAESGGDGGGLGGPGPSAAAVHFHPELLQPKQLRCSQSSRPWPWGWGSTWQPQHQHQQLQQQQQSGPYADGGGGGGGPWGGAASRADPLPAPLHGAHAGAAAVLKRLGSTGGARRPSLRV